MAETVMLQIVYNELKDLKREVVFIKEHMFDPDTVMTLEEGKRFEEAMKEFKEGKTTSLSTIKKELGL